MIPYPTVFSNYWGSSGSNFWGHCEGVRSDPVGVGLAASIRFLGRHINFHTVHCAPTVCHQCCGAKRK